MVEIGLVLMIAGAVLFLLGLAAGAHDELGLIAAILSVAGAVIVMLAQDRTKSK